MLYVTSRNNQDTFPAQRAVTDMRGPDGGLFLPFQLTQIGKDELAAMAQLPFNQCVAQMLNHFFQTGLTGWDLDFGVGRFPVRLQSMSHRIVMVESWHNTQWEFEGLVRDISALVRNDKQRVEEPGAWMQTGVRIAVLFGVFGELIRAGIASEESKVDVSLVAGDFSAPLSAWIARQMGLPIGNIVLCCNENSGVWNLVYHGEFRTDAVSIQTTTPEADIPVPAGLEALIYLTCGQGEAQRYLDSLRRGRMYCPEGNVLARLREGMEVSVISQSRLEQTIPSVFGTNSYLLSPYSGLAYAGLLDYRARTGESGYGLVLAEKSPAKDSSYVCAALGISASEYEELLKNI